jgi:Flp pilus assembly protein TadG
MTTRRRDRGQVTAFVVVLVGALMVCAGLVVDGGRMLAASRDARDAAAGAARAGAQALDVGSFRDNNTTRLDPTAATARADTFLAQAGYSGTVAVAADRVTVTITTRVSMVILGAVGVGPRTITVTESAATIRTPQEEGP